MEIPAFLRMAGSLINLKRLHRLLLCIGLAVVAQQLLAEDREPLTEQSYRVLLSGTDLAPEQRVTVSLQLSQLLIERAQHESGSREALHAEATPLIEEALNLAKSSGMHREAASLYRLHWLLLLQQGQYSDMTEDLKSGIEQLDLAGADDSEKMDIFRDLSYTCIITGRFSQAKYYLRRTIVDGFETRNELKLTEDFLSMGDAYLKTGEYDISRRYYDQVLQMNPGPDSFARNQALLKLGTIDRELGKFDEALRKHEKVYAYFSERGLYRQLVTEIQIAEDYFALGQLGPSRRFALKAFEDPRAFVEQRIDAALILMKVAYQQQNLEETGSWMETAGELLNQAIAQSGFAFVHPLRQIRFAAQAIEYNSQKADDPEVVLQGDRGLAVYRHVRKDLWMSGDDYMAWSSTIEPFISKYVAALYRSDRGRILQVLEDAYATGFSAGFNRLVGGKGGDLTKKDLEAYLLAEKALVDAQADWEQDATASNERLLDSARNKRDELKELYLAARTTREPGAGFQPRSASPAEVSVADGDLLLRYYVSREVSFVLARTTEEERFYDLPGIEEVKALVDRTLAIVGVVGLAGRDQLAALTDLAVLLPLDLLSSGRFNRLLIVPDNIIHQVPFSAINIGDVTGAYQPAGLSLEVVRIDSVFAYNRPASKPVGLSAEGRSAIAIFADPVFSRETAEFASNEAFRNWSNSLQRLPYTAREAESISSLFPSGAVFSYLGPDATSSRLMSPEVRSARILHIATHGYFNDATPDIVGIATSIVDSEGNPQRGFLSLTELLSQPFYSNLVIISGCETMLGRSYRGLGMRSLASGLIEQGVGSVIGTLWRIPDRATAEFMGAFYQALQENQGNASRALMEARLQFIQSSRYSNPVYWAGFALTSSSREIETQVFQY